MGHVKALATVVGVSLLLLVSYEVWKLSRTEKAANVSIVSTKDMETNGVPNIEALDIFGNKIVSKDFRGKIVIVNFWASWCAPCIQEVPSMIKIVNEFKGDIQLIAISGDSQREDIDAFLKSFPEFKSKNIHIIWDQDSRIMKQFDVTRLPESFIAGKDQKLVKKISGSIEWYNDDSKAYMKDLLSK